LQFIVETICEQSLSLDPHSCLHQSKGAIESCILVGAESLKLTHQ